MMIRSLITLGLLISFSETFAAQYISMDATAVKTVNLSARNHNRIGMVGDRIKKAFFRSSNITVDVEEETGQIFIQSARPNCPTTTLSVVSASGVVQDLELVFCDISSEIVLLQPVSIVQETGTLVENCVPTSLENSSITYLVEQFIKGFVPEGYTSVEDNDSPVSISEGLKLQRVCRLISDEQIVFVHRLQNVSHSLKNITECQVNVLDGDWVFLDRYKLKKNECALVLIGCMR